MARDDPQLRGEDLTAQSDDALHMRARMMAGEWLAIVQEMGELMSGQQVDDERGQAGKQPVLSAKNSYLAMQVTKDLGQFKEALDSLSRAFVTREVLLGHMSRKMAASLLGVHQITVGRWATDAQKAQDDTP